MATSITALTDNSLPRVQADWVWGEAVCPFCHKANGDEVEPIEPGKTSCYECGKEFIVI